MNIRYKISPDVNCFNLILKIGEANYTTVKFEHKHSYGGYLYFVDIIKTHRDGFILMKIFMPDGKILQGYQSIDWLCLHNTENLFDGRFNSDKYGDV